jgi:hypothetical protein
MLGHMAKGRCEFTIGPRAAGKDRRKIEAHELAADSVFGRQISREERRDERVHISRFHTADERIYWRNRLQEMKRIEALPRVERSDAVLLFYNGVIRDEMALNHDSSMSVLADLKATAAAILKAVLPQDHPPPNAPVPVEVPPLGSQSFPIWSI